MHRFPLLSLPVVALCHLATPLDSPRVRIDVTVYNASRRHRHDINSNVYYEADEDVKVVLLGDWRLELGTPQDLFLPDGGEWISGDGSGKRQRIQTDCEFWLGHVTGSGASSSMAGITICAAYQVTGFLRLESDSYFVEFDGGQHFLYRSSSRYKRTVYDDTWAYYNLTGDTFDIGNPPETIASYDDADDVQHENAIPYEVREADDPEEIGYFFDSAWQPSVIARTKNANVSKNPKRWLEIAVAVDATVIFFHGKKQVEQYVLTLMNIVNAIYQDPSLDANLQLVVTRLLLYEHKHQSVVRMGNAKKSLENVNIWNRGLHLGLAPGERHHDVAVWLTRSDIGGPSGYAPVSGACDPERSCALNRDEGLSSAFIIAHEMAHILGLSHDGDSKASNDCGDDGLNGSVMAPMVSATFHQFMWSQCSRNEFQRKARKWSCLLDSPAGEGERVLNDTLRTAFSMDEQCRMEFGDGYALCRAFDILEPCSHLWCGHVDKPLVCKTKKGPPIEGTECGFDKWCANGYCQPINRDKFAMDPLQYNPKDGGWSDWSPWRACSRSCGTGVEFRVRKCDNPTPLYGGSDCFGLKEEWRICNIKPCPDPIRDIRAQQCKRLPRLVRMDKAKASMTWLPFESEQHEMKCKLICASKESKELFVTGENFIDGTPCSYENRSNICIQGTCQPLGCDKKLFSNKQEDSCGVCDGNNIECRKMQSTLKRKLKRDINRVALIPKLAREIKVEANVSVRSTERPNIAFIVKERKRSSYSITVPNTQNDNQIVEGTKFYYRKESQTHVLWTKGPLLAEVALLVSATRSQLEMGISISLLSQYYVHKDVLNVTLRYKWIGGGWGPCSKTCGGGRKYKTKACWDTHSNKIVHRKRCALVAKPEVQTEQCNSFSCNFSWMPGDWEPCSATCGSYGVQHREVYCLPQSSILHNVTGEKGEELWKLMVPPSKCGDEMPTSIRACYRRECPTYWEYGIWSECSTTCGVGVSTRHATCVPPVNETSYYCNKLAPIQTKVCKNILNKKNSILCKKRKPCFNDQSKYCNLPSLERYCVVPAFRNVCCKSCLRHKLKQYTD